MSPCPECERELIPGRAAGLCPFCLLQVGSGVDYTIVNVLDHGGHGTVYLAEQQPTYRLVTVKVLSVVPDPEALIERLRCSLPEWAALPSLHIARPLDVGLTGDRRPYVIREYVRGAHITTHCKRRGAGRCARQRLIATVSDVVVEAHDRGMTHGGLKPSNVLIVRCGDDYLPKIVDGGLRPGTPADDMAAITRLTAALL